MIDSHRSKQSKGDDKSVSDVSDSSLPMTDDDDSVGWCQDENSENEDIMCNKQDIVQEDVADAN